MVVARTPLEEISSAESRDYLGACTLFLPSTVLKVAQIASDTTVQSNKEFSDRGNSLET